VRTPKQGEGAETFTYPDLLATQSCHAQVITFSSPYHSPALRRSENLTLPFYYDI
jgi:hypothetical protein